MTDLAMFSLLVGALLPALVAVVQQSHWPPGLRAFVAFASCLLAGLATVFLQGSFTWHRWVSSVLLVCVAAYSFYGHFWKPTGIAPAIETATPLPTSPPPPPPVAGQPAP